MPQETTKRQLVYYQDESGKRPFRIWLHSLKDSRTQKRVQARLARVQAGNLGDYKSLKDGVFELRLDFGPGFRIYFGQHGETVVILLCAGDKSDQSRDIENAKEYWKDYKSDARLHDV